MPIFPDGILATPLRTVPRTPDDDGVPTIAALVAEHHVVEVVVGLPLTLAGREGPAAGQVVVTIDCALVAVEARSITYEGDEVAGGTRLLALAVRCWRLWAHRKGSAPLVDSLSRTCDPVG